MSVPFAPTLAGVQLMGLAWWLLLPAAAGGAWAICKLYRRETEPYPEARRWLFGLRAAAIALLALLLSQPVLHRVFARYQPPLVLVLRDNSPSMKVQDRQEPVERKLREAVVLGLIDAKLRDTRAEEAAQGLERAHADLEAATVSARQALQVLQQSAPDAGAARDRLAETRQGLAAAAKKLDAALDAWQGAPGAEAGELGAARKSAQDLKKLDGELGESDLENAQARQLLATRAHGVHELALALEKHAAAARMRQDLADRALAAQDRPEIQAALKKLAGMDRAALVDAVLDGKVAQAAGDRVQTVSYRLDSKLRPIEGAREEDAELEDAGTKGETDLATPLLRLAERHAQDPIAAVVLCSDGRHTSGPAPEEAARALAARGIVLHTLGAGGLEAPFDLCVARLEGSPSVFLDETIRLTAHLKVAGLQSSPGGPEIKNAKLVLRRGDEVLDERAAAFGRDGWFQQEFELKAEQAGTHVYGVTLEPLPGEALAENNHAEAVVDVANDRLKVLLADLMPRWESRYVASLLRRERKMTLDERWLLSGDGLGPKPAALPDDEQALEACDVVILGDIPRTGSTRPRRSGSLSTSATAAGSWCSWPVPMRCRGATPTDRWPSCFP
ncbi:MAG: hypothetical protein M5U26_24335 [Planctomycetota bacterium]|nr:hypothetical protein [Planctomycetota bacterium]